MRVPSSQTSGLDEEGEDVRHGTQRVWQMLPAVSIAELCLFGVIAIASTWPLAMDLGSSVPLGTEHAATVPLFTSWSVWWNCDRLTQLYADYWDAPIFYACHDTFAFSEPLPLTVLGAPIHWQTKSPAATCNTLLLLALTINGWSAFKLFYHIHQCWIVALLGGLMVELLPFVHHEIAVFQLVPLGGVIWTMHSLYRSLHRPSMLNGIVTGVCCGVTYLLCSYYGLFFAVLLVIGTPWLLSKKLLQLKTWCLMFGAVLTCALIIAPVVYAQLRVTREHGVTRSKAQFQRFSATLSDYRSAPWQPIWYRSATSASHSPRMFPLHPGTTSVLLALIGAPLGLWYRGTRRWTAFSLAILLAAILLSFGPGLHIFGWSPYGLLIDWVPGFSQARSIFRFALFAQLMNAQLAVTGLLMLLYCGRAMSLRLASKRLHWIPFLVVISIGALGVAEVWPPRQRIFRIPPHFEGAAWISSLRDRTPADSIVACLPFPRGKSESDYESTALWMYSATYHQRRLVNGYSGFFPSSFLELKAEVAGFPDHKSIRCLRERGVQYCVVDRTEISVTDLREFASDLELFFSDGRAQVDIYRIVVPPISSEDAAIN